MAIEFGEDHTWIEKIGNRIRIGISSFAAKELGEVVYVELPRVGSFLKKGEEAIILESTKAATDICSPISGRIVAVNEAILITPSLITSDPEGKGFLIEVDPEPAIVL
jgi:glycine cleavage system H protein